MTPLGFGRHVGVGGSGLRLAVASPLHSHRVCSSLRRRRPYLCGSICESVAYGGPFES